MLNFNDPQSEFIFQAAVIQDRIHAELLLMCDAKGSAELIEREERICLELIPQLHRLNQQHFNDSPKISQTLQTLEHAVRFSNRDQAWQCFINLVVSPGDNFGTWAI